MNRMQNALSILRDIRLLHQQQLRAHSLEQLNKIPKGYSNNLFWNIAHCLAVQQALCYRLSGLPTSVESTWVKNFARGTFPERDATPTEVEQLDHLLLATVDTLEQDLADGIFQTFRPYTTQMGTHLDGIKRAISFNNVHEGMHYGYLLALRKQL